MFRWLKNLFSYKLLGGVRSGKWVSVRRKFLKTHPYCAVCGRKSTLLKANEVHHVVPVNVDPLLELIENNLIVLCREHHFLVGHLCSWFSWNSNVRKNADEWRVKILQRP